MSIKSKRQLHVEGLEPRTLLAADGIAPGLLDALDFDPPPIQEIAQPVAAEKAYVPGDANRDGWFDQSDLIAVLQSGKYRTEEPATWAEGDWNGDKMFDETDFMFALKGGNYRDRAESWPDIIPIPLAFEPEGVELGKGSEFFVGTLAWSGDPTYSGSIYKGDLRTGDGEVLVEGKGKPISGLSYDARTDYLYAATGYSDGFGGPFWEQGVKVFDASSGELITEIIFGDDMVINDLLVTNKGVYITDSVNPVLYKIPLEKGGKLTSPPTFEKIEMKGFVMVDGFNGNGLVGDFDGKDLVVINIKSGVLYKVDTETGDAIPLAIQGDEQLFGGGDGLYMEGRTLYIMRNFPEKIAVVQLSGDLTEGTFVKNIVSDDFAIPTTIIGFGDSIYAINTDFCDRTTFCGLENPDTTQVQSELVRVDK